MALSKFRHVSKIERRTDPWNDDDVLMFYLCFTFMSNICVNLSSKIEGKNR